VFEEFKSPPRTSNTLIVPLSADDEPESRELCPDRLRMRAVVGLELPGDRGDLVAEESRSQRTIIGRDAEVLWTHPLPLD
jgi:hypothetical protein